MQQHRETVNPHSMATPTGFAHGIKVGNVVYLGGQTALGADHTIVQGGMVEQFTQAFTNVLTTLREAGGNPTDLVDVTIHLTEMDDYLAHGGEIERIWRELAGREYPALTCAGVTQLRQPGALIEIKGVAVIGSGQTDDETQVTPHEHYRA